jgi:hypothetical protein
MSANRTPFRSTTNRTGASSGVLSRSSGAGPRRTRPAVGGVVASVLGLAVTIGCSASGDAQASDAAPTASGPADSQPFPYQVGVAREGNVVVVIESTGWAERTEVALELALQRAIPGAEGRCGENVLPCPHPAPSLAGSGPFDLTASPTLTEADWARITRGQDTVVGTDAPPAPLLECVAIVPGAGATSVHARSYDQLGRPGAGLHEFVFAYEDDALATGAVTRIRDQFLDCPDRTAAGKVSVQLHEHSSSDGGTWWLVDQALVGDRTFPGREPLTGN